MLLELQRCDELHTTALNRWVQIICAADLTSDGTKFDAIHVGAAAATMPDQLCNLLAPGGKMVIPIGAPRGSQVHIL
jgi:protein-L-isoaspartate O-methyltransferase